MRCLVLGVVDEVARRDFAKGGFVYEVTVLNRELRQFTVVTVWPRRDGSMTPGLLPAVGELGGFVCDISHDDYGTKVTAREFLPGASMDGLRPVNGKASAPPSAAAVK